MSYLKFLFIIFCFWGPEAGQPMQAVTWEKQDSVILERFWEYAREKQLEKLPVARRIVLVGRFFLSTPYKAGTLNVTKEELPVINLRAMDCVTFVENTLALAFLDSYTAEVYSRFVDNIIRLRYRKGEITDYSSRLHYSTDWLYEMGRQHYLTDVTRKSGGVLYVQKVDFMSKNYGKYPALKENYALVRKMRQIETAINKRTYYYIPKKDIAAVSRNIHNGDIILITTSIKGLDTSHLGIAVKKGNEVFLMHASSKAKKVVITEVPLARYMEDISSQTGIMIARVLPLLGEEWLSLP